MDGNARLTTITAAVLVVLLAAEGATIPFIGEQLTVHMALGLALIPPVLLKLDATTWRFAAHYYLREPRYVRRGPPPPPADVAARRAAHRRIDHRPVGHRGADHRHASPTRARHRPSQASFIVWFGAMAVHVLGHMPELPKHLHPDRERELPGARLRSFLLVTALVAGTALAISALPAIHHWVNWAAAHHRHDR